MRASRPRAGSQLSAEPLRSSALRLPGTGSESAALLGACVAPSCSSGATFEMQIAEPAKTVDARKDSMVSLFSLWVDARTVSGERAGAAQRGRNCRPRAHLRCA